MPSIAAWRSLCLHALEKRSASRNSQRTARASMSILGGAYDDSPAADDASPAPAPAAEKPWRQGVTASLPASSSQVLVECAASAANVQSPKEFVEHWKATPEGGFKMIT